MKLAALVLLLLLVLAAPARARAEAASIASRDLPLRATPSNRLLQGSSATPPFTLVGLHWQGSGTVEFRTRRVDGRWSAWHPAAPEDEDRPDADSGERGRPGWRLGNPYWTGPSDRIEYRTRGLVRRLRGHFVWSAPEPAPRTIAVAGSPAIVPRLSWGANESIKRGTPLYAPSLRFAVVHHTAGSNGYTRAESAAIVKAIQIYHVSGNGWNDIGYNFLVDRFGQVFEGRFGGMEQNVVGAHAEGFNTGSVGVAVLGNYDALSLSPAARKALADVIAWRLDLAHVDPISTFNWLSGGNSRFPRGVPVFLRAVIGHRDTGFTTCPGDSLYDQLGQLADDVSRTGLPKLYGPQVRGATGGRIRFTARLSGPLPWTVTVTDSLGATVATGTGVGAAVDWTWDSAGVPPGTFAWSIVAGGLRPARGTLGTRAVALTLSELVAEPSSVTPNGDGRDESALISYRLSLPATVTAKLLDPSGRELATLFSEPRVAGRHRFTFAAEGVPDGTYSITLTALASGRQVTASVAILVNRTLSGFASTRRRFSPNGDGRLDTLGFTFALAAPARVRLRILRDGAWVATPFEGDLGPGSHQLMWDGRKRLGRLLDGGYEAEIEATDVVGTVAQQVPFSSDTKAPELRLLGVQPLRFRVSEAAAVVLTIDGRRSVVKPARAGAYAVPGADSPRRVRAVAWDAAGNVSLPARYP